MSVELVEVELWVKVDEEGDYSASTDANDLHDAGTLATRLVKVTVKVPKPRTVELVATIAAEPETGELKVA